MYIVPVDNFQAELTQEYDPNTDTTFYMDNITNFDGDEVLSQSARSTAIELTIFDEVGGQTIQVTSVLRQLGGPTEWEINVDNILDSAPDYTGGSPFPVGSKIFCAPSVKGVQYLSNCSSVTDLEEVSSNLKFYNSIVDSGIMVFTGTVGDGNNIDLPSIDIEQGRETAGPYMHLRAFIEYTGGTTWSDNLRVFDNDAYQSIAVSGSPPDSTDTIKLLEVHYYATSGMSEGVYVSAEWKDAAFVPVNSPL